MSSKDAYIEHLPEVNNLVKKLVDENKIVLHILLGDLAEVILHHLYKLHRKSINLSQGFVIVQPLPYPPSISEDNNWHTVCVNLVMGL